MTEIRDYDVTVESGIIAIFQNQSYKLSRVFSEFIDNALQSYLDHKTELDNLNKPYKCKVTIMWKDDSITITDNAYGMNNEEFGRALKLKATNPNALRNDQLSIYGMGLKYAAVYLGNHYSISSTAFMSDIRYYAEVDVPDFEKNNPKTVQGKLFTCPAEMHETTIKITNLRVKLTADRLNEVIRELGTIYNHYINYGELTINLNNNIVTYTLPALREKEDGGRYYEQIQDSFSINGNKYTYTGWMAILAKGNQSITGLNIIQAKRCIELGYKPEKLFGQGNSFQNSRVIGEIVFSGENYVLSFDKDKFVWADDGAEELFIESMRKNSQVKYILKMAKELKNSDNSEKLIAKTGQGLSNTSIAKKANANLASTEKAMLNTTTSVVNVQKSQTSEELNANNIIIQGEEKAYKEYSIMVDNKRIPVYVDMKEGKSSEDWIKFSKHNDGFLVKINYENGYINSKYKTQAAKAALNEFAIVLSISMINAQKNGLKLSDSKKIITAINEFMGENNGK